MMRYLKKIGKKLHKLYKNMPPNRFLIAAVVTSLLLASVVITSVLTAVHTPTKINHKATTTHKTVTKPKITKKPATTPKPAPAPKPTTTTEPAPAPKQVTTPAPTSSPSPGHGVSGLSPAPSTGSSTGSTGAGTGSSTGSSTTSSPSTTKYYSQNWSGYMAVSGTFTTISGSWVVPNPTGNGTSTSADASWIGIGGVNSNDLIQTGTDNTVSATGQVSSSAFYELLPAVSQNINSIQVTPGDSMSASIDQTSSGNWTIEITDNTTSKSFTTSVSYTSSLSSAEWIEEDPSYSTGQLVPFDNYGTVTFSSGLTTYNASSVSIYGAHSDSVTMLNSSNQAISTPSNLNSSGNGFTVTRENP